MMNTKTPALKNSSDYDALVKSLQDLKQVLQDHFNNEIDCCDFWIKLAQKKGDEDMEEREVGRQACLTLEKEYVLNLLTIYTPHGIN